MYILWRSADEVQVGTDPSTAHIIGGLAPKEVEFLLAAPSLAPARREAERIRAGISDSLWERVSTRLRATPPHRPARGTVVALDSHPVTDRVRAVLERLAIPTVRGSRVPSTRSVAVLTEGWVTDPVRVRELMVDDVPHLPIVVEEEGIAVGPTVVPGGTPCTMCLHLARTEQDPMWPTLAAQLVRLPSRRVEAHETEVAAVLAAHTLIGLLDGRVNAGWRVSGGECLPLTPPSTRSCGCGSLTPLSGACPVPA